MLDDPTLVLNRSWTAISTTTVRTAFSLVYRDVARIIEPVTYQTHDFASWAELAVAEGEGCVRTVRRALRVPEIIVLTRHNRQPHRNVPFSRRSLYRRDGNRCQYCDRRLPTEELSIDHVVPRAQGGRTTWQNCVLSCVECNAKKGARRPDEAGMRLLRRPGRPKWSPCLAISLGRRRPSWEHFVSEQYWNVTLEDLA